MLGSHPMLGRTFSESEGLPTGPSVVLLSEGLWRDTFHSDPNIVGQVVKIGGKPSTVVGVMPASFRFPDNLGPDLQKGVWLPIQPTPEMLKDRGYHFFNIAGVMRPGATIQQLQQEVSAIAARIPHEHEPVIFRVDPYHEVLTGPVRPVLIALFGALGLVLLIACANVSNLLIARSLGRQQEFAVRAALGAGRSRLVGQMLSEGLLLSILGCGVGVGLAELAMTGIRKLPDGTIPLADSIAIHWTVLLVLAGIAAVTTVLSSLLPALLVARANPQTALQAASRGIGSKSAGGKLSGWLVAGEVALSTLLLVGTGLLFRTLWNLEQSHLGFQTEHVTTFTAMPTDAAGFSGMAVSEDTQNAPASVATITYQPVLDRIRQLPGFEAAAMATSPPLSGMDLHSSFDIVGQPADRSHHPQARVSAASGDYAHAMGTPLIRGRMIGDSDTLSTPFVVVVNETLAKTYFAEKDPLGKQINLGGKDTGMIKPYTIVGVLADQVDSNVGGSIQPLVLLPHQQIPTTSLFYQALLKTVVAFVVKTRGSIPVARQMRTVFHQLAPGFALDNFQTMQEAVDKNTFIPEGNSKASQYSMDGSGRYTPAVNRFPSAANDAGFKPLADYVHSLGLKFGIHILRGIPKLAVEKNLPIAGSSFRAADAADSSDTCPWNFDNFGIDGSKPGAQAYYDSIAKLYASWEVDLIKVDCISSRPYKGDEIRMLIRAGKLAGRLF